MTDLEPELTLTSAIIQAIQAALREAWTAVPGRVTQWDAGRQLATIEPGVLGMPPVVGVRVVQPAASTGVYVPVTTGTQGILLCCTVDASAWLLRGVVGTPASERTHQLSYSVFLPGVGTSVPNAPSKPTIGDMSHTAHPIALGDRLQTVVNVLHTIMTGTTATMEPVVAALQTAWIGAFGSGPAPTVQSSDGQVTSG